VEKAAVGFMIYDLRLTIDAPSAAGTTLAPYGVRRLVGALRRVTCHPARARSAPDASREGLRSLSLTATSRLAKAVTSHRTPQSDARRRSGVRRQSAAATALWLQAKPWQREPKRCRAALATALQIHCRQVTNCRPSRGLLAKHSDLCAVRGSRGRSPHQSMIYVLRFTFYASIAAADRAVSWGMHAL